MEITGCTVDIVNNGIEAVNAVAGKKVYDIIFMDCQMPDKGLQFFAHTIKSSSANVGAMHLSEICKDLEMACKNNTVEDAEHYISAIESEFVKVKSALKKEIISC